MIDFKLTLLEHDLTIVNGRLATIDTSNEVAQNVKIRLMTYEGEWFLDVDLGVPWFQQILGKKDASLAELLVRKEINSTTGVSKIVSMNPLFDYATRNFSVYTKIQTVYGNEQTVSATIGG